MPESKSIDDLIVNEDELNEALVAEILEPYVQIGGNSGAFVPSPEFDDLQAVEKTAIVLVYEKAKSVRDLAEDEKMAPSAISEASGINYNNVKWAVRQLDEMALVDNDEGTYSVPTYRLEAVKELVQGDG